MMIAVAVIAAFWRAFNLLRPNLFIVLQFYLHLCHKLEAVPKKTAVAVKANIAKVLFHCYTCIDHLVASL
jgi:hypothetical protein